MVVLTKMFILPATGSARDQHGHKNAKGIDADDIAQESDDQGAQRQQQKDIG